MTESGNSNSSQFNSKAVKAARRKLFFRRMPRFVVYSVLFLSATYLFSHYLSNVPRERFARGYKFLERVWLGAETVARMTSLKLSAHHEDMKNTELPVVEIYMRGKRLDKLKKALPNTSVGYEKAKIRVGDKGYTGSARFRGDSINHWAFPNKSWRVRLKDGEFYRGMQYFNLNVPRVESQIANWLGYQLAKDLGGVIAPHAENVHFRLNRKFDGVRLLLEQPNQDMLIRRYFPPGKIFVGDIETEQIYGGVKRKRLYSDPTGWQVRGPGNDISTGEIETFLSILENDSNPYLLHEQLNAFADMEAFTKYMALLELVGSVHIDETHNGKLYFHPHLGKMQPIVWDTVAYMWGNSFGVDIGVNRLFRVILQNPAFREMKDRALWGAIEGNLKASRIIEKIDREADRLRRDLYAFPFKLHANDKGVRHITNKQLEEGIARLKQAVVDRDARIREHLTQSDVRYKLHPDLGDKKGRLLTVQVNSPAGFQFEKLIVSKPEGRTLSLTREIIEPGSAEKIGRPDLVVNGDMQEGDEVLFQVADLLSSKRKFDKKKTATVVPGTYRYRLRGLRRNENPKLVLLGKSSITERIVEAKLTEDISPEAGSKPFAVWWSPEKVQVGKTLEWKNSITLNETLRLGRYDSLTVAPGTQVTLGEGVSLYVDGSKVAFNGTEKNPITVKATSVDKPWGTIALRNVQGGTLSYVKLSGGSFDNIQHVRYEGLLAVHGGEVVANNIEANGHYLSARSGRLTLQSSTIRSPFPFAVKAKNAIVRQIDTEHEQTETAHNISLLSREGVGTPVRAEREFKFSIITDASEERDLLEVAKEIRKALERRADDRTVWNAPNLVGNDYYVDDKAEDFLFRDVYFDTKDSLAYENQISYRYRNRYKSWKAYKEHVKKQSWPSLWPYRLEYQAKVGRKELGEGFSTVDEARFEFRDASAPFSPENKPPDSPWEEQEFLTYFENGEFKGQPTYPAQAVLKTLKGQFEGEQIRFLPKLVLVTDRFRQHLNIPSEYGSGPNPEQSFIISLDKSRVYPAGDYLKYLNDKREGLKYTRKPASLGALLEIEVEFERNVSDVLDRKIKEATSSEEKDKLTKIREAFIADQKVIMQVVDEELRERGLRVKAADKSKYVQAYELAALSSTL